MEKHAEVTNEEAPAGCHPGPRNYRARSSRSACGLARRGWYPGARCAEDAEMQLVPGPRGGCGLPAESWPCVSRPLPRHPPTCAPAVRLPGPLGGGCTPAPPTTPQPRTGTVAAVSFARVQAWKRPDSHQLITRLQQLHAQLPLRRSHRQLHAQLRTTPQNIIVLVGV